MINTRSMLCLFGQFLTQLWPLIDVRIWLCSISCELICGFQSNFVHVYALILTRSRFGWLNNIFRSFSTELCWNFVYLSHFLALHQKIFVPYIILLTARLSLFHTVTLFSPLKYIVYKCYSCFRQRRGHFFSSLVYSGYIAFPYIMHCIHLSRFFGTSSENICPIHYIVHSSSRSVSHCNSVFSFKLHCLQMLQLFQTKKRSFFFHRHTCIQWLHSFSLYNPLYTLVTLFWCFIRKYLPHTLYCAQLVSVCFTLKLLFSPLKYIVYKCYSCFRQRRGHFFSSSHLYTVVAQLFPI